MMDDSDASEQLIFNSNVDIASLVFLFEVSMFPLVHFTTSSRQCLAAFAGPVCLNAFARRRIVSNGTALAPLLLFKEACSQFTNTASITSLNEPKSKQ